MEQPLRGMVVGITRPGREARRLAQLIRARGGEPYVAPTIEVKPINRQRLRAELEGLRRRPPDLWVFMSRRAVEHLFERSGPSSGRKLNETMRRGRVLAVGPRTLSALASRGIPGVLTPREYSSEGVARLLRRLGVKGKSVAIIRASNPPPMLRERLEGWGAEVREIAVYEVSGPARRGRVVSLINGVIAGGVHALTFLSSRSAENFVQIAKSHGLFRRLVKSLRGCVVAAIGKPTRRTLERLGVRVQVTPRDYTAEALVEALAAYVRGDGR